MTATGKSDADVLAERAARYHKILLDLAQGPGGMILSIVSFDRRLPFQEGDDFHWWVTSGIDESLADEPSKPTVAEFLYGENTLFVTGALLWSQMLRYQATGEPEALATARKCFRDLSNIFRLCWEIEPGLLGKPHGGRAGATTSFDQAANPVIFYAAYARDLATPAERELAVRYLRAHGEYYLRRDWVMNHHGHLSRVVDRPHTSLMKYLVCLYAAYELTGETSFRDETRRRLREVIAAGSLPWPTNPYETHHNLFYWSLLCDYWSRTELADEFDWDACIRSYWRACRLALDDEGVMLLGNYDHKLDTFTRHPDEWLDEQSSPRYATDSPTTPRGRWVSATSINGRPSSAIGAALLALLVRARGLDDGADTVARRALLAVDESRLRWFWDDGKLPDELRPLLDYMLTDLPAIWLVAYWMGRLQRVW